MSYIGVQTQNQVSPQFQREVVTGTGVDEYTLIQDVPGFNADNIIVVVNNVLQEPNNAYTITADANGNPRVLNFNGTNLATTDTCYVQHRGVGSLNLTPAAGSVNAAALQDNLRSGSVDQFLGSAASNGSTELTLTEAPLNANSISVFLGGVYQRPTTNYTVSGTTLTFTGALAATDEIDVHHHTIRSTVSHVPDGGVTSAKLDTNIAVAGTLGVTGTSTLTGVATTGGNLTVGGDLTVTGNSTVNGTTTTINSTTLTVDDKNIELGSTASPTDSTADGGGITLKGATDKTILWENDTDSWNFNQNIETSTTTKVKQKGAFMQSSTHQSLTLGY